MTCPGKNASSYRICVQCGACRPGFPPRVSEILEVYYKDPIHNLVEGVLA